MCASLLRKAKIEKCFLSYDLALIPLGQFPRILPIHAFHWFIAVGALQHFSHSSTINKWYMIFSSVKRLKCLREWWYKHNLIDNNKKRNKQTKQNKKHQNKTKQNRANEKQTNKQNQYEFINQICTI